VIRAQRADAGAGGWHVLIGLAGLQFGGCQINAVDLARELRTRGHQVTLFAVADDPIVSVVPLAQEHGFEIEVLPAEATPIDQGRHIDALVTRHQADVVHVFGSWLAEPATFGLARHPFTALVVLNWTMANTPGLPPFSPLLVGTEALRSTASRRLRAPVLLLEPPVDTEADRVDARAASEFRERWGISHDERLLVLVSRLDRDMKAESVAQTIRATAALRDPAARLVVVGHGDAAEELGALAAETNRLAGRPLVTLTGSLQDPRGAYSAADVVLAMGGAALRGLSFGRPTIVLGEGGFCRPFVPGTVDYFLREGYYGIGGTTPDPVVELRDQLIDLLGHGDGEDLSAWSRRTVVDRYSLDVVTTTLVEIYARALVGVGPARRQGDVAYLRARRLLREVRRRFAERAGTRAGQRKGRTAERAGGEGSNAPASGGRR
jgi:glycosyltransferase involved in cell wall biosynthesis